MVSLNDSRGVIYTIRAMALGKFSTLLLVFFFGLTHAAFTNQDIPFRDAGTTDVTFVSSNRVETRIKFLEERTSPTRIAIMEYEGDTFPPITNFEEGKTNEQLGAVGEKDDGDGLWYLVITKPQDFENPNQKSYQFHVDTGIGSPEHLVSVTIENINDNAPIINPLESECKIEENNPLSAIESTCKFSVLDRDGGAAKIKYSVSDPRFGVGVIDTGTDFIVTVALSNTGLDFEEFSLFILSIEAQDADGTGLVGTTSYVVQVVDVADTPPVWTSPIIPLTIPEELAASVQVTAIDGDIGIKAEIGYELQNENRTYFSIDSTGLIQIAAIDRDALDSGVFTFDVIAFEVLDSASRITSTMTVIVEDVNDNVPTISANPLPMIISIAEQTVMSLDLGIEVNDPDLGDFGQFDIKLEDKSGNRWNEYFLLIPNSGYRKATVDISVQNAAALDFENVTMRQITLQLVVSEQKDSTRGEVRDIVINLTDWNDESPVFDSSGLYTVNILESIKKNEVVTTVRATDADADAGDVVTHSFSTAQKALSIDPVTGEITVKIDNAFDFERQTEMIVQVLAEDSAGHKSVAQLAITVDDVNDTPPILDMPTTQPNVTENARTGTPVIASLSATDEDTDGRIVFSIDWTLSSATKQGAKVKDPAAFSSCIEIKTIYPDSADQRTAEAELFVLDEKLDWETFDTLSLRIVATDENTDPAYSISRFRSATLSIEILDENDESPHFTEDSLDGTRTVFEYSGTGQLIGTVVAIDRDGPGNNDVAYSIEPADPNLPEYLVMIDPTRGDLRVNLSGAITCDSIYGDQMKYQVTASDGTLQESIEIYIGIIDTNDKTPQYTVTDFEYNIMENSPTDTYITTVGATDQDFTEPFHTVSYFIDGREDGRLADLFYLNDKTGVLQVRLNSGAVLDRDEGTTFYEISIIFRDNYQQGSNSPVSNENVTKIIVNLDDENDNPPVFPVVSGYLAEPLENVKAGATIYANLYAPDKDADDNGRVEYSVLSYDRQPGGSTLLLPDNMFTIETTADSQGNIKVTADLKDLWGIYNLELKAEDFGPVGERKNSIMVYTIHIVDLNDHYPLISYPVEGEAIRLKEEQSVNSPLFDKNNVEIPLFRATDEDSGENAVVSFEIVGNDEAKDYFKIINNFNGMPNVGQLQLQKELVPEAKLFQLEINATDNGVPQLFHFVNITLVIVKTVDVEPVFTQATWEVTFMENSATETATLDEPAQDENNDHLLLGDPEWDAIYYYLINDNSPGLHFFSLDKNTCTLMLTEELDREEYLSHTFYVLASNLPDKPTNIVADPSSPSQLVLNVKVGDEDDSAPEFETDLWPGGISTGDPNGKIIMTIVAVDPDEVNDVTYLLLQETMIADPSLAQVQDNAFVLDAKSGQLVLNFNPDSRMSGYFEFKVAAYDVVGGEGHTTNATVKIFIITDANRVVFKFLNEKDEVEVMKREMVEVFTKTIGYNCTVDSIIRATDSAGIIIDRNTDVTTHFIDSDANEPVDNSVITAIVTNREKITEMKQEFLKLDPYALVLTDYDPGTSVPPQSYEELLRIILIVVSVVLGTLLILLFAAFFIKTRSLNRRLEALSTTKFGSQDSGLNRVGMSAPGANKRAIEGSNPVWGEDIGARDYDNISQGSYDSDLIGVEENPEFNTTATPGHHVNAGYDADDVVAPRAGVNPMASGAPDYPDGGQVPRNSINPLSNGGTARGLSHQVSIDSQISDDGTFPGDDNFTFANKNNSIPITDL